MDHVDIASIEAIRTKTVGLLMECPLEDNPLDCPLHEQRNLPFTDKFNWLQSLSDPELTYIYSNHCECMKIKTS